MESLEPFMVCMAALEQRDVNMLVKRDVRGRLTSWLGRGTKLIILLEVDWDRVLKNRLDVRYLVCLEKRERREASL